VPALRAAHIGVAMGERGTDLARESSDLILTDDNFASIVAGIEEGRIAYGNVRKVIFLLVSSGAAEVLLFVLTTAAGPAGPAMARATPLGEPGDQRDPERGAGLRAGRGRRARAAASSTP